MAVLFQLVPVVSLTCQYNAEAYKYTLFLIPNCEQCQYTTCGSEQSSFLEATAGFQ